MILMSCPECRRAVSDNARFCPYCGGAISAEAKTQSAAGERSSMRPAARQLKGQLAAAIAVFWVGIVLAAVATPSSVTSSSESSSTLTLLMPLITGMLIFAGVLGYVVTKLRIRGLK